MLWLKSNNPFCSDVEIDSTDLNSSLENGDIEHEVNTTEIASTFSNNFENDIVVEFAVPIVAYHNSSKL